MHSVFVVVVILLCAAFHIAIANKALSNFPSVDEVAHLPAGIEHWRFGRFEMYRVNPPLARLLNSLPAYLMGLDYDWDQYTRPTGRRIEFSVGITALKAFRLDVVGRYWWPRLVNLMVVSSLFAVLLLRWLKLIAGLNVCCLTGIYFYFSPNMLSHSPTIIPDAGCVVAGMLLGFAGWSYSDRPSFSAAIAAGFALGIAVLTKLTWLTGFIAIPTVIVLYQVLLGKKRSSRKAVSTLGDLLLFWCTACLTLNAGYLFEDTMMPLGSYEFSSAMLAGEGRNALDPGNRFDNTMISNVPIPLPRNFVLGIDYLKFEVETMMWSFLMGEWKLGSWPHYYVMTTLFKTPEPTLLGALIGLGVLVVGIRRKMVKPEVISMFMFLIIPAAVCFASVSLQGGFNHHHRYVLMIYPPMFALAAYIASPVGMKLLRFRLPYFGPKKRSIAVPLAFTLVALSAVSSLRVHPYYTSYFNTLSGGPQNGWRLLGFSNIDWGQDILEVDKWLKRHPDRRPLVMDLDYFNMNGDLFSVETSKPPKLPKNASIDEIRRTITETQWWIISVKRLYNQPDKDGLEYLQRIQPTERIAYSYHVYRIDPLE